MEGSSENAARVAALCRRLGSMWSENDVVEVFEDIPETEQIDCNLTLYGKLLSRTTVNVPAFISTMRKAWKVEQMEVALLDPGVFSFKFISDSDKNRILEEGPWCFSRDLLVLKQCEPDTPDHCYDFSQCAFWVQLKGIPRGRLTAEVTRSLASKIGPVLAVKIEAKGNNPNKVAKARILLNLAAPLKYGIFLNLGYKKIWIDFKYERLPMYCYSCGCMGHYTTACESIPFVETGAEATKNSDFGGWLRAEVRVPSPFWTLFYGKELPDFEDEEMSSELTPPRTAEGGVGPKLNCLHKNRQEGKGNVGEASQLITQESTLTNVASESTQLVSYKGNAGTGGKIIPVKKKLKRANPYAKGDELGAALTAGELHETPILTIEEGTIPVLVVGHNKPLEII